MEFAGKENKGKRKSPSVGVPRECEVENILYGGVRSTSGIRFIRSSGRARSRNHSRE